MVTRAKLEEIKKEYWLEMAKAENDFINEIRTSRNTYGKNWHANHYTGNGYGVAQARLSSLNNCLMAIDEALRRFDKGTYGICEGCKEKIPIKRLRIIPYTRFCVVCCQNGNKNQIPFINP